MRKDIHALLHKAVPDTAPDPASWAHQARRASARRRVRLGGVAVAAVIAVIAPAGQMFLSPDETVHPTSQEGEVPYQEGPIPGQVAVELPTSVGSCLAAADGMRPGLWVCRSGLVEPLPWELAASLKAEFETHKLEDLPGEVDPEGTSLLLTDGTATVLTPLANGGFMVVSDGFAGRWWRPSAELEAALRAELS